MTEIPIETLVEPPEEILTEEDKRILENADVITGPEALKQFAIPLYLEGKRHIYCFNHDVDPLTKYKMSDYPTSSDSLCYKCFKQIQGVPLMPPRLYDDKRKIYTLVRFHMCSVACVLDYYWHNHERIFGQLKVKKKKQYQKNDNLFRACFATGCANFLDIHQVKKILLLNNHF